MDRTQWLRTARRLHAREAEPLQFARQPGTGQQSDPLQFSRQEINSIGVRLSENRRLTFEQAAEMVRAESIQFARQHDRDETAEQRRQQINEINCVGCALSTGELSLSRAAEMIRTGR